MLKGKTLLDYTNLFSPNDFKKNDRVSSVKWGLLARNEVGLFQIFDHVKTIKKH